MNIITIALVRSNHKIRIITKSDQVTGYRRLYPAKHTLGSVTSNQDADAAVKMETRYMR